MLALRLDEQVFVLVLTIGHRRQVYRKIQVPLTR